MDPHNCGSDVVTAAASVQPLKRLICVTRNDVRLQSQKFYDLESEFVFADCITRPLGVSK